MKPLALVCTTKQTIDILYWSNHDPLISYHTYTNLDIIRYVSLTQQRRRDGGNIYQPLLYYLPRYYIDILGTGVRTHLIVIWKCGQIKRVVITRSSYLWTFIMLHNIFCIHIWLIYLGQYVFFFMRFLHEFAFDSCPLQRTNSWTYFREDHKVRLHILLFRFVFSTNLKKLYVLCGGGSTATLMSLTWHILYGMSYVVYVVITTEKKPY